MSCVAKKWGNSLGVRIPQAIAMALNIHDGSSLDVKMKNGSVIISPRTVPDLKTLLKGVKPENRPEVFSFKDVGKEIVE